MTNFQLAVQFLVDPSDGYAVEGGYVNDPNDAGGETKYGITKRTYPNLDIKNLTLADAISIYKRDYWDVHQLDSVSMPLAVCIFDAYVQHRQATVRSFLNTAKGDWRAFNQARRVYYLQLIQKNPQDRIYQGGWMNRITDLNKYCDIISNQCS